VTIHARRRADDFLTAAVHGLKVSVAAQREQLLLAGRHVRIHAGGLDHPRTEGRTQELRRGEGSGSTVWRILGSCLPIAVIDGNASM
jgi:hypothetical protein